MTKRITRRQFGQLAIAGTTAAGLTYFANKTFAQTPKLTFVGVRPGEPISIDDTTSTVSNSTEAGDSINTTPASTEIELLLPTLNVANNQVQTPKTPVQGVNLKSDEELSGFTSLSDGTLVIAITPVSTSNKENNPTRLVVLSTPVKTLTVSGLNGQEKLGSLVGTTEGGLLGLAVKKNGTPPVRLVEINVQTGAITSSNRIILPGGDRFDNLAQCPDGKLYTTVVDQRGLTSLVQLDLGQKKPVTVAQLKVNNQIWNNGLQSLVGSPSGQLFAFGARRYETPNKLYTVNPSNGEMSMVNEFDAAKITLSLT